MLLGVGIVVDADKEDVAGVFGHLLRIAALLYLVDTRFGILVLLQLNDEGGLADVLARYQHNVGEALARGILTVNVIVIMCIVIGDADDAGQRVLC